MQALGLVWGEVDSRAPDYRESSVSIERPVHPGAHLALSIWRAQEDGLVVGRDIPSRKISSVLRNLAIYEPLDDGADFRVRVAGTAFYRRFGRDITGGRMSDMFDPHDFAQKRNSILETLETGEPQFFEVERAQGSRRSVRFELLLLPILAPDRLTDWALTGLFFHDWVS
jgi:hypothetical protein